LQYERKIDHNENFQKSPDMLNRFSDIAHNPLVECLHVEAMRLEKSGNFGTFCLYSNMCFCFGFPFNSFPHAVLLDEKQCAFREKEENCVEWKILRSFLKTLLEADVERENSN
jgi:hypothetical protein